MQILIFPIPSSLPRYLHMSSAASHEHCVSDIPEHLLLLGMDRHDCLPLKELITHTEKYCIHCLLANLHLSDVRYTSLKEKTKI